MLGLSTVGWIAAVATAIVLLLVLRRDQGNEAPEPAGRDPQPEDDAPRPRSAAEAARRVLGLLAVLAKVHQPESSWAETYGIRRHLSPNETGFLDDEEPSEHARVQFSWRAEALVPLLWALGGLEEMPPLNENFSFTTNALVQSAVSDPASFLAQARLRSADELSDMEQDLVHQHWRLRDAELFGAGSPFKVESDEDPPMDDLDPDIVVERRYGMSWLMGWGACWDDVPTDT